MPHKPNTPVFAGQTFDRWTLIEIAGSSNQGKLWLCRCICGTERIVRQNRLIAKKSRSCGCLGKDSLQARATTHGQTKTTEYQIFRAMHQRCENPKNIAYANYGGRGITVCERWKEFENFIVDMGERPSIKHSIERIDNNGSYCPENCRWATAAEQSRNKRTTHLYEFEGRSMILPDWAKEYGVSLDFLWSRIREGWPIEEALTRPLHSSYRKRIFPKERCGESVHNAKLTEKDVREIREKIKAKIPLRTIAAQYGVNWSAIGGIKYKRTWKHIPE